MLKDNFLFHSYNILIISVLYKRKEEHTWLQQGEETSANERFSSYLAMILSSLFAVCCLYE